jgi:hypothetical protein
MGKKVHETPFQPMAGHRVHTCQPNYLRKHNPGQPTNKDRPHLKITNTQKGWKSGSSSRAPVQQVQSPEFNPQYHHPKKGGIGNARTCVVSLEKCKTYVIHKIYVYYICDHIYD